MKLTTAELEQHRQAVAQHNAVLAAHFADDPRTPVVAKSLGFLAPALKVVIHAQVLLAEQGQPGIARRIIEMIEARGDAILQGHLEAFAPQIVNIIDGASKPIP